MNWPLIIKTLLIITLIIVPIVLLYRRRLIRKHQQEKLIEELKMKSIQSQLNPHFLFNALNSIQQLINSGKHKQANIFLIGLSELLRGVLGNSNKKLVSLSDELKMVDKYCELEKLRTDFDININVNTESPPELIEVPFMLLQPLIENAFKYGFNENNNRLDIDISQSNDYLIVKLEDNGKGFETLNIKELTKNGKGLQIVLNKLESIYGNTQSMFLNNKTDNSGAVIELKLSIG